MGVVRFADPESGQASENEDRDKTNVAELRKGECSLLQEAGGPGTGLERSAQERQVVYLVPAGEAVFTFARPRRTRETRGLAEQSDLFRDPTGHGKGVTMLTTYCYFAAVYGRSPVGLPFPGTLEGTGCREHEANLNRLLQEIAWEAVCNEPLTGVKSSEFIPFRSERFAP